MVALVLSLGVANAFADASITITPQEGNAADENTAVAETYHAYKVLDAVTPENFAGTTDSTVGQPVGTTAGFVYTIAKNSPWYAAVRDCGYFDISVQDGANTPDIVTLKEAATANETTAIAIAAALAPETVDKKEGGIDWDYNLTLNTKADVSNGYYLIVSSLGEKLILATTDITIKEKNTYPSIDKEEKDEDLTNFIDDGQVFTPVEVAVGDEIEYKVEVFVPGTANQVVTVTDTMSAGLTFNYEAQNAISAVIGTTAYTGFTVDNSATNAHGWKLTIPADNTTKGNTIVFTFKATINSSAVKDDADKKNTVKLDYSNFSQSDWVPYELMAAGIHKYDGNTNQSLAGVKFTLAEKAKTENATAAAFNVTPVYDTTDTTKVLYYVPGGESNVVVTDADGKIIIRGLDKDKIYTLTETETLTGYNLLVNPVTLTLVEDTGTSFVLNTFDQVENNKGTQLPSTGGIGTTIFYAVGGILVLAAIVLLITKKRMSD